LFDRSPLYEALNQRGLHDWARHLHHLCQARLTAHSHGNLPQWIAAWERLPSPSGTRWSASGPAIVVDRVDTVPASLKTDAPTQMDSTELKQLLKTFHPWRKGPFHLLGIEIDTEWRSNWKWDRIAQVIDFKDKLILDVGCGNGYYGWRMLDAGAELVLGCEPFPLYWMQFEVLRRYAPQPERHWVVPLADHELLEQAGPFDVTLSMGVLYHSQQPVKHLRKLRETLVPGGQMLVETLIIESDQCTALVPEGRYAKMKNIGSIPSLALLARWLEQAGLVDVEIVDVSPTTLAEQRRTEWMTFESLADFLDPHDLRRTIEGYPAPVRAVVAARRPID